MAEKPLAALRSIQPFLMVSKQFLQRDPVVSYYSLMHAVQEGILIPESKNDPEVKRFLLSKMDDLGVMKKSLADNEAITNEIVGQSHIEDVGFKLFEYADKQDRVANFHKNIIKAFFTCSHIFSLLKQFGELSEEIEAKMKYAKWKAVEIDRCLKSGITPTPGPPSGDELFDLQVPYPPTDSQITPDKPTPKPRHQLPHDPSSSTQPLYPPDPSSTQPLYPPGPSTSQPVYPPGPSNSQPLYPPGPSSSRSPYPPPPPASTQAVYPPAPSSVHSSAGMDNPETSKTSVAAKLSPEDVSKVQKLCKFACSALDYDDTPGAVDYLTQALHMLKTAK